MRCLAVGYMLPLDCERSAGETSGKVDVESQHEDWVLGDIATEIDRTDIWLELCASACIPRTESRGE
jgi:hypothetical protein